MGETTGIAWTDATWNPVRGCTRLSEGCRLCYAERVAARFSGDEQPYAGLAEFVTKPDGTREARWTGHLTFGHNLDLPLRWKKPRRIFVNSMSDLFHEAVPDHEIDKVFAVMALAPRHTFQILTKRPKRMRAYFEALSINADRDRANELPARWQLRLSEALPVGAMPMSKADILRAIGVANKFSYDQPTPAWPLPNVWLGVSCEDHAAADARIPDLLATPAAVRFVSIEPMLGPIDLRQWLRDLCPYCHHPDCVPSLRADSAQVFSRCGRFVMETPGPALDWIIVGSESGSNARPCSLDWVRAIRDQCGAAGVPFFWKQHVVNGRKIALPELDGRSWAEFPA
jgi:protein gp37